MIEAKRQYRGRPRDDRIADDHCAFCNRADAKNRHLRLIDDRRAEQRAGCAGIGDRERAARDVFRLELLAARARSEVSHRLRDASEILRIGMLDDRDDQSGLERHSHTDVDVLVIDDAVAFDRGVEHRMRLQRVGRRLDDEG